MRSQTVLYGKVCGSTLATQHLLCTGPSLSPSLPSAATEAALLPAANSPGKDVWFVEPSGPWWDPDKSESQHHLRGLWLGLEGSCAKRKQGQSWKSSPSQVEFSDHVWVSWHTLIQSERMSVVSSCFLASPQEVCMGSRDLVPVFTPLHKAWR